MTKAAAKEFYNLADLVLNYPEPSRWGNLGYWQGVDIHQDGAYSEAAHALAKQLARALDLQASDCLLDVGFGTGQQFAVWQDAGVSCIGGINISNSQLQLAQQQYPDLALHLLDASKLAQWEQYSALQPNKIVALDCAYHFADKHAFIGAAAKLLPADGCLVLSDLVLGPRAATSWQRFWISLFCRLAQAPYKQWLDPQQLEQVYQQLGFTTCEVSDISADVLPRFGEWYRIFELRHGHKISFKAKLKFRLTARFLGYLSRHQLASYLVIKARKTV